MNQKKESKHIHIKCFCTLCEGLKEDSRKREIYKKMGARLGAAAQSHK